jgi:adenylate cyclase
MLQTKLKEIWRGAAIGALLATASGFVLLKSDFQVSAKLIHASYNLPFSHRPAIKPEEVVMVYMDEDSHRELQQPYYGPWDRGVHAQLVERLTADGARAVVFDVIFSDPNPEHPDGDERFARAIKNNGKVILGAEYGLTADKLPTMYPPFHPFYDAAAGVGFVEVIPDADFTVRRHLHVPPEKEADSYSSLNWEAAKFVGAAAAQNPDGRFTERWLNYYGPTNTIPGISFRRAIETNEVPLGAFSNKVVFVGSSLKTEFSGMHKDEYYTPYSKGELSPAVDVQATQFLNLLRGDWLTRFPRPAETVVIILAGILFGFGLTCFRPPAATTIAIVSVVLIVLAVYYTFQHHRLWFPWMIIVAAQIPIALLWSVVFNSIRLYVQKKLLEQALARYLSPKLVKKFAGHPDLLKPGATKQMLTILFTDIANFTSISEGIDSDDLASLMNGYFERAVSECIHRTDGTVVKYIGDAIFAFWNAPEQQSDHALRACEAALHFRGQGVTLVHGQPLYTRIGLHTGVANVGNFGSSTRVDYTAIGENINLASRMEGLNKHLGTQALITSETKNEIGDRLVTRPLGRFRLKGFDKNVEVFELLGRPESAEGSKPLREAFALALRLFQEKNFGAAGVAFHKVLQLEPKDGPAKFYLNQTAVLHAQAPPEDWGGEVELKEK